MGKPRVISLVKANSYVEIETSYGGNQTWFGDQVFSTGDAIYYGGCGLIAMADLLLYLSYEDQKIASALPNLVSVNHLSRGTYQLFVESLFYNYLEPWRNPLFNPVTYQQAADFVLGIQGWQLKRGLRRFFRANHLPAKQVSFLSLRNHKSELTSVICQQLQANQPVPLLIGPTKSMFPRALSFLGRLREVPVYEHPAEILSIAGGMPQRNPYSMTSHWVMITGYLKEAVSQREFVVISSWGEKFLLDFTAYQKDVDFISGLIVIND